jgi:hypothetical protein
MKTLRTKLDEIEMRRLKELWGWLVPADYQVIALSPFGDLFLSGPDGGVYALDVLEGQLCTVARNVNEFEVLKNESEFVERWLWPGFYELLLRRFRLQETECFGFTIPPVMGGELALSNLKPMNIVAYHSIMSQLHRQINTGRTG